MKNLKAIMLLFLGLVLVGCSSDDSGGSSEPATGNYFPSTMDDLWIYNVENRNADDDTFDFDATDLLTVNSVTATSFTVDANGADPANGRMSEFLENGTLGKTESTLLYNGVLDLPAEFSDFSDETITLVDFVLYDLNASNGEELSSTSGTFTQDFPFDGATIPLTIDYVLSTTNVNSGSNTLTVDGTEYTNVIQANISLEVTVIASMDILGTGTITEVDVLNTQDVLSIDYYFSQDVGLIKANATQGYAVADTFVEILTFGGIVLDIPTTVTVTNNQEIDSFIVE
ncbi:hypothetical protein ACFS5M_07420 [Lacinutrix iliipiscaria]|uniref:Lipoprotein n=1 Tax=Lacinutrix iliipiscaria TaxID=1230532 RepID=A0ABW5WNR7_9FLAO